MLLFYALLFFLSVSSVVSVPVHAGRSTPTPDQGHHPQEHKNQPATTSLGHRRPEDGYWVLKRPQVSGILLN